MRNLVNTSVSRILQGCIVRTSIVALLLGWVVEFVRSSKRTPDADRKNVSAGKVLPCVTNRAGAKPGPAVAADRRSTIWRRPLRTVPGIVLSRVIDVSSMQVRRLLLLWG